MFWRQTVVCILCVYRRYWLKLLVFSGDNDLLLKHMWFVTLNWVDYTDRICKVEISSYLGEVEIMTIGWQIRSFDYFNLKKWFLHNILRWNIKYFSTINNPFSNIFRFIRKSNLTSYKIEIFSEFHMSSVTDHDEKYKQWALVKVVFYSKNVCWN